MAVGTLMSAVCFIRAQCLHTVVDLGTGELGSHPGRHLFMTMGGRHERLLGGGYLSYWGIGISVPPAEKVSCTEVV